MSSEPDYTQAMSLLRISDPYAPSDATLVELVIRMGERMREQIQVVRTEAMRHQAARVEAERALELAHRENSRLRKQVDELFQYEPLRPPSAEPAG